MHLTAVKSYLESLSLPAFRQRQITTNYFSGRFLNFSQMTDLPLGLRHDLDQKFSLLSVKEVHLQTAADSQKALLQLSDGHRIETVLMDYHGWITVCASTQVGCPLGCKFCATGQMGFIRHLTAEEIVDQIVYWKHFIENSFKPPFIKGGARPLRAGDLGPKRQRGLRVVFMGMGEPFLNWDNLLMSLNIIKNDLKIGSRKISISTAGIIDKIKDFANLDTEINLAISLHSAVQSTRAKLMPVAQNYPLPKLLEVLHYYTHKTHRQLFLEYAPMADTNDTPKEIAALIKLLRSDKLFYLNLIPLNPVKRGLVPSTKLKLIEKQLIASGISFSIRHSLGQSISSACGQLVVNS